MILIDAVYINQSGGKVLLEYFIKNIKSRGLLPNVHFLLDSRLDSPILEEIGFDKQNKILASESNRKVFYKKKGNEFSVFFCFANVPPPIAIKDRKVYILFHNTLILDNKNSSYGFLEKMSFFLKRLYIKKHTQSGYEWIVQTKNMSTLLSIVLKVSLDSITIAPFFEENRFLGLNKGLKENNNNFLYVADGVEQKNHRKLLTAWELIADQENIPVYLHLTVPEKYPSLLNEVDRLTQKGVKIINHGNCSFEKLQALYEICNCFIAPSLAESFGLPIIEAAEAGCEIIAADLEYIYDIVNPLATFDPHEAEDIAKKVINFYNGTYSLKKTNLVVQNKIDYLINLTISNV